MNSSAKKSYRDLKELIISRIKRTKTQNLDLTASGIDDNFLDCIMPYIEANKGIKKIKLSMNSVTDRGLTTLLDHLKGRDLKSLFLAQNLITEIGLIHLSKKLKQGDLSIETVCIQHNKIQECGSLVQGI